jgi:hypothetical protein
MRVFGARERQDGRELLEAVVGVAEPTVLSPELATA